MTCGTMPFALIELHMWLASCGYTVIGVSDAKAKEKRDAQTPPGLNCQEMEPQFLSWLQVKSDEQQLS